MAQWTETLEPYVKVTETIHTSALNPTAGEDLIIGAVIISDAGPSVPTLISSQSEFVSTYASTDLSEDYLSSLNSMYTGGDATLPATMWANAYRLAGSNTMLVVRASKGSDISFVQPLVKGDNSVYILRDGALLKSISQEVKLVIDTTGISAGDSNSNGYAYGWSMNINGIGIVGNRTTDDGAQYDYYVGSVSDLVDQLNDTSMFFSPSYTYYSDVECTTEVGAGNPNAICVVFHELYLGADLLDTSDDRCPDGIQYVIPCEADWTAANPTQSTLDLNFLSDFEAASYYATNVYNSAADLKIRIRRFNHDAVSPNTLSTESVASTAASPWNVLTSILDTFTSNGKAIPSASVLERDFYEICIIDPSVANSPQYFNVGSVTGLGDMTVAEVNGYLSMISLNLPANLYDLGLNYYDYQGDDMGWEEVSKDNMIGKTISGITSDYANLPSSSIIQGDIYVTGEVTYYAANSSWTLLVDPSGYKVSGMVDTFEDLSSIDVTSVVSGTVYAVGVTNGYNYYEYATNGDVQFYVDLTINAADYRLLDVSDANLKSALDLIELDEVYTTEGLCDLGNTELSYQSYMANMAINSNYFYPISTVRSTNYMTIANSASKISQTSEKLYLAAPWDLDTGTLGWSYYASPAVIYWEAVARNTRNNNEFAAIFGQSTGVVQYQSPMTEFNKKTRQLLLTKKVNTVLWNNQTSGWNFNDSNTKEAVATILSDDGNSRLAIRISKAMPVLLKQFIGWKISAKLWASATAVIDYWFKTSIMSMNYSIDAYVIQIDQDNNPTEIQAANKMVVSIRVRYQRSLKYIEVYHDIYDVGMDIA